MVLINSGLKIFPQISKLKFKISSTKTFNQNLNFLTYKNSV